MPSPIEEELEIGSPEGKTTLPSTPSTSGGDGEELSREDYVSRAFRQDSPLIQRVPSDRHSPVAVRLLQRQHSSGASSLSSPGSKETSPEQTSYAGSAAPDRTSTSPLRDGASAPSEPGVNLYLDLRIYVDSGRCVFHTDEPNTGTNGGEDRPGRLKATGVGSTGKQTKLLVTAPANETIFPIPGLNVESYYVSLSGRSRVPNEEALRNSALSEEVISHMMTSHKRAQFCLWCSLQRMPEETEVSPHILDFFEKTLEPLSGVTLHKGSSMAGSGSGRVTTVSSHTFGPAKRKSTENLLGEPTGETSSAGAGGPGGSWDLGASTASFPVDVVLYIAVHSSAFRFTSLPASRVQCLLKLPSLSLVATSRKSSDLYLDVQNRQKKMFATKSTPLFRTWSSADMEAPSDEELLSGGVSVTASLSDFSLFIFHPYGSAAPAMRDGSFGSSPRKDSLSLVVTSVVVNVARSRNVFSVEENSSEAGVTHLGISPATMSMRALKNSVRFSLVIDIGTAVFKYDMRRLNEILSFPKAWYRRSIVRRLFLGDEGTLFNDSRAKDFSVSCGSGLESCLSSASPRPRTGTYGSSEVVSEEGGDLNAPRPSSAGFRSKEGMDFDRFVRKVSQQHAVNLPITGPSAPSSGGTRRSLGKAASLQTDKWEAVVLFVVNFAELDVQTNMGNTMGITTWRTQEAASQGNFHFDSIGNKNVCLSFALGSSVFDSKGGMVGGNVILTELKLFGRHQESAKREPQHSLGLSVASCESKVEWMGTTIFMASVSDLEVDMRDEWKILTKHVVERQVRGPVVFTATEPTLDEDQAGSSFRGLDTGEIFFNSDINWKCLQIMITNSTASDLIKIGNKLTEFFEEAFTSGKRILLPSTAASIQKAKPGSEKFEDFITDTIMSAVVNLRYHRHWQKPMESVSKLLVYMKYPFPKVGMILGGTLHLSGEIISLACFHGQNFRSQKWAVFHLNCPVVTFSSEAKDLIMDGKVWTKVFQTLEFFLGNGMIRQRRMDMPMALVLQVERGAYIPPQVGKIDEWFYYTFGSVLQTIGVSYPSSAKQARNYRHSVRTLFRFPSLQMRLSTHQLQGQEVPISDEGSPVVDCTYVAEFDDHLLVSADVEALYFLHELITSFVKENQRQSSQMTERSAQVTSVLQNPTEELQKDARSFSCQTWHMEPTVRFLDMAQIEPYGMDSILQKLGFKHARTTIPKWIQRGFMDPLDALLARTVDVVITVSNKERERSKT